MNLNNFQFTTQAQAAIDAGRDPVAVAKMQLDMQAQEAIKAGRDPDVVNKMLSERMAAFEPQQPEQAALGAGPQPTIVPQQAPVVENPTLRGMIGQGVNTIMPGMGQVAEAALGSSPQQLKKIGEQVSTAAGGALLGSSNITHKIGEAGLDLVEEEGLSDKLTERRERSTQQFKKLPLSQENPEAANFGIQVGESALPTVVAAALPITRVVKGAGFVKTGLTYLSNLAKSGAVGAATGYVKADTENRTSQAITEGLLFAGVTGVVSALGKGISGLSNSKAMQRFWAKIPFMGNRGFMQRQGAKVKKAFMEILHKHDKVGNKAVGEVEDEVWNGLTAKTKGIVAPPDPKVLNKHTALYKKLLKSEVSDKRSAAIFMKEYTEEINRLDDFTALKELRTSVSKAQFGKNGLAASENVQNEVKSSIRDLITSKLENIAKKSGSKEYFKAANFLTQKRIIADEVEDSLRLLSQKDADLNDLQAIKTAVQGRLKFLKDSKVIKGPVAKTFEKDFHKVADRLGSEAVAVEALKNSKNLGTLTAILSAGAAGGATYALGVTPSAAVGGAAGIAFVLALMARKPNYMTAASKVMDKGTLPFLTFIENMLLTEGRLQSESDEIEQLRTRTREGEQNGS